MSDPKCNELSWIPTSSTGTCHDRVLQRTMIFDGGTKGLVGNEEDEVEGCWNAWERGTKTRDNRVHVARVNQPPKFTPACDFARLQHPF